MFRPAFSVYTAAWRAWVSSQSPKAVEPVKSMIRTSGWRVYAAAVRSSAPSAARITRFGSKPASVSTSRAIRTVIARGRTAPGCGLTTTGLPVTRLANRPG